MEPWETELREKLNKELEDGEYQIQVDELNVVTGKSGYIDFQVRLRKNSLKHQIANATYYPTTGSFTKQMFEELLESLYKFPKEKPKFSPKRGSNRIKPKKRK